MGFNKIDNAFGQFVFMSEFYSIGYVLDNHLSALFRSELVVRVEACFLVFGKVNRVFHLTDVVIEGTYTYQEGISSNLGSSSFGKISHLHRVLEGAWSFFGKLTQELGICIGEF